MQLFEFRLRWIKRPALDVRGKGMAPGVTDLPIDRIGQAVQPTPGQRAALDELKDASVRAAEGLKADCRPIKR